MLAVLVAIVAAAGFAAARAVVADQAVSAVTTHQETLDRIGLESLRLEVAIWRQATGNAGGYRLDPPTARRGSRLATSTREFYLSRRADGSPLERELAAEGLRLATEAPELIAAGLSPDPGVRRALTARRFPEFARASEVLHARWTAFLSAEVDRTRGDRRLWSLIAIAIAAGGGAGLGLAAILNARLTARGRDRALAELRQQASADPLTGLLNQREFHARLARECRAITGSGHALGLVLFDLDAFKEVNDRFGHRAGDGALVEVAGRIAGQIGESDVLARIGGEEFALIAPGRDANATMRIAERVRCAVRTAPISSGIGPLTISAGVAQFLPGDDSESLFGRADLALYRAKRAGRDRVLIGFRGAGERGISSAGLRRSAAWPAAESLAERS